MSFTTTLKTVQEGSILLSPTRNPRTQSDAGPSSIQCTDPVILPPNSDLYKWTFTKDAVASCFIRDVFNMKQNNDSNFDFFWLGRVPCRTVHIVALVVGVQQYENNTRYTVDDGTAVIDCIYRHIQLPSTPKKQQRKSGKPQGSSVFVNDISPIPQPIASVGDSIRLQGKVTRLRDSRCIKVEHNDLSLCRSGNEEPLHWMNVIDLHQNNYDLQEPFTIPPHTVLPPAPEINGPISTESTVPTTPSTVATESPSGPATSPAEAIQTNKSTTRLRHPSRLRSRDLTDITFSIYVKYYMDNAPLYRPLPPRYEKIPDTISYVDDDPFATPTPANRRRNELLESPTPRRRHNTYSPQKLIHTTRENNLSARLPAPNNAPEYGFTLSYLRRVPDLALLARRVVEAERKRRDRELRRQAKEAIKGTSAGSLNTKKSLLPEKKSGSTESVLKKMKRLFIKTIRDLYSDGKIVLWDGPVRVWSSADCIGCESLPWKASASDANTTTLSTVTTSPSFIKQDDNVVLEDLSDPDEHEESYISITSRRVAALVEGAIKKLIGRSNASRTKHVSVSEILSVLHGDVRWANIGEWAVGEALEMLQSSEVVYKVGNGRWALCI